MGKQQPRAGAARSIYVIGTACSTLTVAAVISAVPPANQPNTLAHGQPATAYDPTWSPAAQEPPPARRLEGPDNLVVLDD